MTGRYLSGVQVAAAAPVTVNSNRENRGFPAAINQGLQQARGEYLELLNNDFVVTDAWLDQLVALAELRVECHAGPNPTTLPPHKGRHLNAQANVERNRRPANLTLIDFNGGDPVVVDGSIDGFLGETGSPAACLADSASAPPHLDLAVAGSSLTTPHPFDLAAAGSSLTTLHPFDLTVAGGSLTSSHPFDLAVAGSSLTTPHPFDLAVAGCSLTTPPATLHNSDFSGVVYLTLTEAKIEFKPIEPRNPRVDVLGSELGRQVLVVLS